MYSITSQNVCIDILHLKKGAQNKQESRSCQWDRMPSKLNPPKSL